MELQIIDWFSEDLTNEQLGEYYSEEKLDLEDCKDAMERKIIGWWNWWCENSFENQLSFRITAFGRDIKGQSASVHIENFTPYFYIQIPKWKKNGSEMEEFKKWFLREMWFKNRFPIPKKIPSEESDYKQKVYIGDDDDKKCKKRWNVMYDVLDEFSLIEEMEKSVGFSRMNIVKRKILKEFTNNQKFHFIRIVLLNKKAMYNAKSIFEERIYNQYTQNSTTTPRFITIDNCVKNYEFKLYESTIDPLVRFVHLQNIEPSGWITIKKKDIKKNSTKLTLNNKDIYVDWKNVHSITRNDNSPINMAF